MNSLATPPLHARFKQTLLHARTSVFSAVFCSLLALSLAPLNTLANDPKETIEDVELEILTTAERLKKLDDEIKASRALKEKLKLALKESEQRVGERKSRISDLDNDIKRFNGQLEKLETQIVEEQRNLDMRKKVLAESIRRTQRIASNSDLKIALQNNDPAKADRQGVYTAYFMAAQQQAIEQQQASLAQIGLARTEALKNRNWLNHIKKKAATQADIYSSESTEKRASINQVDSQISNKTKTVAELRKDQARLQTLMEELRAAEVARSGYFEAGKGQYDLPVNGEIKAQFGEIKAVGKLRWNGYFIAAKFDTPVRTVADGEVVYSAWLKGFGMLVIVDHGDSYMTLYGGNRDVMVKKGDWVESGATIATVGDSGGHKTSGVYFEIRHNAKPIDPKAWVSATNGVKSAKK